jgi:hypothetical protein
VFIDGILRGDACRAPVFTTDVPAGYEGAHKVLPPAISPPLLNLAALLQDRLNAKEREARTEAQRVEAAEAQFRSYTVRLIGEMLSAGQQHPGVLRWVGVPGYERGTYGITVLRRDGGKIRIIMPDDAYPYLVALDTGKLRDASYDLGSSHSHGTPKGFVRSYAMLLEDIATWIVGDSK